jgi:hypothetical protein
MRGAVKTVLIEATDLWVGGLIMVALSVVMGLGRL